jgi:hypothetical protein
MMMIPLVNLTQYAPASWEKYFSIVFFLWHFLCFDETILGKILDF